jgi:hypothetical protein
MLLLIHLASEKGEQMQEEICLRERWGQNCRVVQLGDLTLERAKSHAQCVQSRTLLFDLGIIGY